jgi:FKBP-type peptidyl-prolyl cis-trans isomerase
MPKESALKGTMKRTVFDGYHRAAIVAAVLTIAACSGGGGTTTAGSASTTPSPVANAGRAATPQPATGDIELTKFAPALNVRLDSMVRRASGMYVQDLQMGTGAVATRGRTVIVRYSGFLADGKMFDSGEVSVTLGSNKTIRAWEEGLLGMRVGGRRRIVVPPAMGYGARGSGDVIPPNAVLVFDMEMMSAM